MKVFLAGTIPKVVKFILNMTGKSKVSLLKIGLRTKFQELKSFSLLMQKKKQMKKRNKEDMMKKLRMRIFVTNANMSET